MQTGDGNVVCRRGRRTGETKVAAGQGKAEAEAEAGRTRTPVKGRQRLKGNGKFSY